jgi:hypothetical protein
MDADANFIFFVLPGTGSGGVSGGRSFPPLTDSRDGEQLDQ